MKYCKQCGAQNETGAVFCGNCGASMEEAATQRRTYNGQVPVNVRQKNHSNQNLPLILSIIALVIVIIVATVLLVPMLTSDEQPVIPDENTRQDDDIAVIDEVQPVAEKKSFYSVHTSDATWQDANKNALKKGGYLVCINSKDEFKKVCAMAEDADINVFWVGAKRSSSNSWYEVCWLDGERMSYTNWFDGEPTYYSEDGEDENYLMVFKVNDEWYYNDAINDVSQFYSGKMGYIVETEE